MRPIRGSLSSGTASATTCLTDSLTRRIRSLMALLKRVVPVTAIRRPDAGAVFALVDPPHAPPKGGVAVPPPSASTLPSEWWQGCAALSRIPWQSQQCDVAPHVGGGALTESRRVRGNA